MNDNDPHILMGAAAIAAHMGITRRQAYRLIYEIGLPTFRLGGTIAARRSTLTAWLEEQERAARAVA